MRKKVTLFAFLLLFIFSLPVQAVTIKKINDITVTVDEQSDYVLPEKVTAICSNYSTKQVSVKWDKKASTSKVGTFNFRGTVKGYSKKVNLKLTVKAVKLAAPTGIYAYPNSDSEIMVGWDKSPNAEYYHVYCSDRENGDYELLVDDSGDGRIDWNSDYCVALTQLDSDTTQYFKVAAVKNGHESPLSEPYGTMTLPSKYTYFSDFTDMPQPNAKYICRIETNDGISGYLYDYDEQPEGFALYYDSMLRDTGWEYYDEEDTSDGGYVLIYTKGSNAAYITVMDKGYLIFELPNSDTKSQNGGSNLEKNKVMRELGKLIEIK